MRIAIPSLLVVLAACGTSSAPQASSSPAPATSAPTPAPAPATPPPSIPHSGAAAAPAGSASAALLDILANARTRKVRISIDTTHGGAQRPSHMVLESQPPDRRHSTMELPNGTQMQTVLIGRQGWSRMGDQPWRPAPQLSVAVGTAGADDMIGRMSQQIAAGRVQVSEDPAEGGFRMFHIVVPAGVMPGGGGWDGHLAVGGDGLPARANGAMTGGPHGDSQVNETFTYDESIAIEAPL